MDRVKYVARWIAMVPCALAAVLLAPHIVGVLFWISTLVRPEALDPESFLDQLFFEAVSNGAGGAAFVFVGAYVAPGPTAPCRVCPRGPQRADIGNHTLSRRRDGRPMGDLGDSLDRHRVPRRCFLDSQGRNRFDVGGLASATTSPQPHRSVARRGRARSPHRRTHGSTVFFAGAAVEPFRLRISLTTKLYVDNVSTGFVDF